MSYRERRSIRLKNYDYRSCAIYFITICTNGKDMIFGHIKNYKMIINDFGIIARREWIRTARIRTYVELDAFIVMPNHIHGIIVIKKQNDDNCRGMACHAHVTCHKFVNRKFSKPIKQSLSSIIGSYKSSVSREINNIRNRPGQPVWQRNFFERIIRDGNELFAVRQYINRNPGEITYIIPN